VGSAAGCAGGFCTLSGAPHFGQNAISSVTLEPHFGQVANVIHLTIGFIEALSI
jgi:hypothetical protein